MFYNLFKVRGGGREPKENYIRGGVMEKRLRTTSLTKKSNKSLHKIGLYFGSALECGNIKYKKAKRYALI